MGGLFGSVSKQDCVNDLFYGTDYHSHLGTKRGGLAVKNSKEFTRSIHNIENDYFRSKFESDLPKLKGNKGIGVISDNDSQPLIIGSHLGTFAIVTVGKIVNIEELVAKAFSDKLHFSETTGGITNPTELAAMLICGKGSYEEGIENAQNSLKVHVQCFCLQKKGFLLQGTDWAEPLLPLEKKKVRMQYLLKHAHFLILDTMLKNILGRGRLSF